MKHYSKEQLARMSDDDRMVLFRSMALDHMKEHKCRWSEACLAVKKRFPESRASFGAPSEAMSKLNN